MNKKLLAGLTAASLLAGGGSATALAAAGTPAAVTSTAAVVSSTSAGPVCGPLGSLVSKGTITQAQATAIHDALVSYLHDHWPTILSTVLGQLVTNHTITATQASAVTAEITQWMQKYRANGSGDHGPCQHDHDMGTPSSQGHG